MFFQGEIEDLDYFEYAEFNNYARFFCFRLEISFLSKSSPNNQNCYFKVKFCVLTNLNMQSSRGMFTFSVLDWKFLFWVNLVLKIEIVIWSWISYWGWYEYADFNRDAHFFCFRPEIPFLGKLGPAIQNCYFKQKFGTSTNLNMQNSIVMLIFFCFIPEITFFGKFGPKIKIVQFRWNFVWRLIWIFRIQQWWELFLR